ncbi:retrovirus-related pol polyprotein from transposon TNT 1-94 [Tanacetum coccineum]
MNGPYVRRIIPEPGDGDHEVPVNETFHVLSDDELTENELKQVEVDDQAIQTILLVLPKEIYTAVDSYETAQEIWLRVQQMMKGSDIRIQEKKAKLFNEWERFTSTDEESIESYYHCFSKLMNDFKRNKHFLEKIVSNLKFLNNLQPEWSRHATIVHQTKDLHTTDYTQLYDFLKYNQKEVDELRAERLGKTHDPLALIANSNNPLNYPVFHQDQPSSNPTTAMNMELVLMAKAFELNYSTPTNNNQRISSNPRNRQIAQAGMNMGQDRQMKMAGGNGIANQNPNGNGNVVAARAEGNANGNNGNQIRCYNCRGLGHLARNCTVRPRRRDAAYLQTQLLIAQKEEARIQLQDEEFDLMTDAQALTSGTQTDKVPVYVSDGSAENDSNVISAVFNVEQSRGTIEQHPATVEETRACFESVYNNFAIDVEKVNTVNHKLRETNVDLTTKLARYKNQEMCFEISQEKYDKLERCYQKSVYQEQCLTKKINALHLSSDKQITTLNEEIANLNKQLSKEKSIVSSLQEEKKKVEV